MPKNFVLEEQDRWHLAYTFIFLVLVFTAISLMPSIPRAISPFDFLLLILATFRLVRLFMYDSVTGFIRNYFSAFEKGPRKTISNLLDCPWCTGMWMALVVAFLFFVSPVFWFLILILALAGAASLIQVAILRL